MFEGKSDCRLLSSLVNLRKTTAADGVVLSEIHTQNLWKTNIGFKKTNEQKKPTPNLTQFNIFKTEATSK